MEGAGQSANINRILVVQPTLPDYRLKFFDAVAREVPLLLLCSDSSPEGVSRAGAATDFDVVVVQEYRFGAGLIWQKGVVSRALRERLIALVVGGNPRYVSSVLASIIAKIRGVRVVWWGHAMSSTSGRIRSWFRMRLMHMADTILLYYPEETRRLPASLQERAVGLNNSLDTDRISNVYRSISSGDVARFAKQQGFVGSQLLVTIGRLTPKAKTALLLHALAKIRRQGKTAKLAIIGDGPERSALKELTDTLGIADSVYWVGAVFEEPQIGMWMKSADAFVYGGAVGLSLVHAFAYGLPSIISSNPDDHNPEALLFEDGVCGVTYERDNADSLAEAMIGLLSDHDQLSTMSSHVRRIVEQRLGTGPMARRFVAALEVD